MRPETIEVYVLVGGLFLMWAAFDFVTAIIT